VSQPAIGISTFLFTDIEGSTRLLQRLADDYARLLEEHRRLISAAVTAAGGRVFGSEGDALFASFSSPAAALSAAAQAQRALSAHRWPGGAECRVRMGVHTGEAMATGDDYVGLPLHQVARVMGAAHGGQVVVSNATRETTGALPEGLELRDLGEHRLKDLARAERLFQLVGEGLADGFPPLRTLDARPNNLPVQLTSFIGREELAAARRALDSTRLLTLSGPGGTGKTRLALQLAADASDDFPDGVYFVGLETVRDPELLVPAMTAAIGLADTPGVTPMKRLIDHLHGKRVLLVLDNFEQIVGAGATVAQLLRDVPEAKVIVTSRNVLRVYGEQDFPVPPLGVPQPDGTDADLTADTAARSEAVLLFVERAVAVQPSFRLTDENASAVVEIVRRLDGLPLAIELAAARTRVLPVEAIRARLGQRLGLLTGGARDLPARQQTLRGAIDWSYELLDEPERRLFQRFGVFEGGAFLVQAERVCDAAGDLGIDTLDGLGALSDKSLLRGTLAADEDPRFVMLATIREYALERTSEGGSLTELQLRHAITFVELAESAAGLLTGQQSGRWLDRLAVDHDNVRAALDWAIERGQTALALRMVAAFWRFWQIRGHLYVARDFVDRVTAMPQFADEPPGLQARALAAAGGVCYWQGDFGATHDYYSRGLEQARRSGDRRAFAEALYNFGFAPTTGVEAGDYRSYFVAGRKSFEESLALFRELDDRKGIADAGWALAMAMAAEDDLDGALRYGHESLELYRALDDAFGTAWAANQLALYSELAGRTREAYRHLRESTELFTRAGDQSGIVLSLADYAWIAQRKGQTERAWRLGGATEAMQETTGVGLIPAAASFLDWQPPSRPEGDPEGLRAWNEGRRMSIEEAVAFALDHRAGE
jgi:predicted ATPase/class 3 adenylate cyclase